MTNETNGPVDAYPNPLPPARENAFAEGLRAHQEIAAERDALRGEVAELRITIDGRDQALKALQDMMNVMESRIESAILARDQAIGDRAVFETLFISFKSQLNAFHIPSAPLIREKTEDQFNDAVQDVMEEGYRNSSTGILHDLVKRGRAPVPKSPRGEEGVPLYVPPVDPAKR